MASLIAGISNPVKFFAFTMLQPALSPFVEGFTYENFDLQLSGFARMSDLRLRSDALSDLRLPVAVTDGVLESLTVHVPWTFAAARALLSGADPDEIQMGTVTVAIDTMRFTVSPLEKLHSPVDSEDEVRRAVSAKIAALEASWRRRLLVRAERFGLPSGGNESDAMSERALAVLKRCLSLSIKHVHMVYRDSTSDPEQPFCLGLVLESLEAGPCTDVCCAQGTGGASTQGEGPHAASAVSGGSARALPTSTPVTSAPTGLAHTAASSTGGSTPAAPQQQLPSLARLTHKNLRWKGLFLYMSSLAPGPPLAASTVGNSRPPDAMPARRPPLSLRRRLSMRHAEQEGMATAVDVTDTATPSARVPTPVPSRAPSPSLPGPRVAPAQQPEANVMARLLWTGLSSGPPPTWLLHDAQGGMTLALHSPLARGGVEAEEPPAQAVDVHVERLEVALQETHFAHLRALVSYSSHLARYSRYKSQPRPTVRTPILSPEQSAALHDYLRHRVLLAAAREAARVWAQSEMAAGRMAEQHVQQGGALGEGEGEGEGGDDASSTASSPRAPASGTTAQGKPWDILLARLGAGPPDPYLSLPSDVRLAIRSRARGWWKFAARCILQDMRRHSDDRAASSHSSHVSDHVHTMRSYIRAVKVAWAHGLWGTLPIPAVTLPPFHVLHVQEEGKEQKGAGITTQWVMAVSSERMPAHRVPVGTILAAARRRHSDTDGGVGKGGTAGAGMAGLFSPNASARQALFSPANAAALGKLRSPDSVHPLSSPPVLPWSPASPTPVSGTGQGQEGEHARSTAPVDVHALSSSLSSGEWESLPIVQELRRYEAVLSLSEAMQGRVCAEGELVAEHIVQVQRGRHVAAFDVAAMTSRDRSIQGMRSVLRACAVVPQGDAGDMLTALREALSSLAIAVTARTDTWLDTYAGLDNSCFSILVDASSGARGGCDAPLGADTEVTLAVTACRAMARLQQVQAQLLSLRVDTTDSRRASIASSQSEGAGTGAGGAEAMPTPARDGPTQKEGAGEEKSDNPGKKGEGKKKKSKRSLLQALKSMLSPAPPRASGAGKGKAGGEGVPQAEDASHVPMGGAAGAGLRANEADGLPVQDLLQQLLDHVFPSPPPSSSSTWPRPSLIAVPAVPGMAVLLHMHPLVRHVVRPGGRGERDVSDQDPWHAALEDVLPPTSHGVHAWEVVPMPVEALQGQQQQHRSGVPPSLQWLAWWILQQLPFEAVTASASTHRLVMAACERVSRPRGAAGPQAGWGPVGAGRSMLGALRASSTLSVDGKRSLHTHLTSYASPSHSSSSIVDVEASDELGLPPSYAMAVGRVQVGRIGCTVTGRQGDILLDACVDHVSLHVKRMTGHSLHVGVQVGGCRLDHPSAPRVRRVKGGEGASPMDEDEVQVTQHVLGFRAPAIDSPPSHSMPLDPLPTLLRHEAHARHLSAALPEGTVEGALVKDYILLWRLMCMVQRSDSSSRVPSLSTLREACIACVWRVHEGASQGEGWMRAVARRNLTECLAAVDAAWAQEVGESGGKSSATGSIGALPSLSPLMASLQGKLVEGLAHPTSPLGHTLQQAWCAVHACFKYECRALARSCADPPPTPILSVEVRHMLHRQGAAGARGAAGAGGPGPDREGSPGKVNAENQVPSHPVGRRLARYRSAHDLASRVVLMAGTPATDRRRRSSEGQATRTSALHAHSLLQCLPPDDWPSRPLSELWPTRDLPSTPSPARQGKGQRQGEEEVQATTYVRMEMAQVLLNLNPLLLAHLSSFLVRTGSHFDRSRRACEGAWCAEVRGMRDMLGLPAQVAEQVLALRELPWRGSKYTEEVDESATRLARLYPTRRTGPWRARGRSSSPQHHHEGHARADTAISTVYHADRAERDGYDSDGAWSSLPEGEDEEEEGRGDRHMEEVVDEVFSTWRTRAHSDTASVVSSVSRILGPATPADAHLVPTPGEGEGQGEGVDAFTGVGTGGGNLAQDVARAAADAPLYDMESCVSSYRGGMELSGRDLALLESSLHATAPFACDCTMAGVCITWLPLRQREEGPCISAFPSASTSATPCLLLSLDPVRVRTIPGPALLGGQGAHGWEGAVGVPAALHALYTCTEVEVRGLTVRVVDYGEHTRSSSVESTSLLPSPLAALGPSHLYAGLCSVRSLLSKLPASLCMGEVGQADVSISLQHHELLRAIVDSVQGAGAGGGGGTAGGQEGQGHAPHVERGSPAPPSTPAPVHVASSSIRASKTLRPDACPRTLFLLSWLGCAVRVDIGGVGQGRPVLARLGKSRGRGVLVHDLLPAHGVQAGSSKRAVLCAIESQSMDVSLPSLTHTPPAHGLALAVEARGEGENAAIHVAYCTGGVQVVDPSSASVACTSSCLSLTLGSCMVRVDPHAALHTAGVLAMDSGAGEDGGTVDSHTMAGSSPEGGKQARSARPRHPVRGGEDSWSSLHPSLHPSLHYLHAAFPLAQEAAQALLTGAGPPVHESESGAISADTVLGADSSAYRGKHEERVHASLQKGMGQGRGKVAAAVLHALSAPIHASRPWYDYTKHVQCTHLMRLSLSHATVHVEARGAGGGGAAEGAEEVMRVQAEGVRLGQALALCKEEDEGPAVPMQHLFHVQSLTLTGCQPTPHSPSRGAGQAMGGDGEQGWTGVPGGVLTCRVQEVVATALPGILTAAVVGKVAVLAEPDPSSLPAGIRARFYRCDTGGHRGAAWAWVPGASSHAHLVHTLLCAESVQEDCYSSPFDGVRTLHSLLAGQDRERSSRRGALPTCFPLAVLRCPAPQGGPTDLMHVSIGGLHSSLDPLCAYTVVQWVGRVQALAQGWTGRKAGQGQGLAVQQAAQWISTGIRIHHAAVLLHSVCNGLLSDSHALRDVTAAPHLLRGGPVPRPGTAHVPSPPATCGGIGAQHTALLAADVYLQYDSAESASSSSSSSGEGGMGGVEVKGDRQGPGDGRDAEREGRAGRRGSGTKEQGVHALPRAHVHTAAVAHVSAGLLFLCDTAPSDPATLFHGSGAATGLGGTGEGAEGHLARMRTSMALNTTVDEPAVASLASMRWSLSARASPDSVPLPLPRLPPSHAHALLSTPAQDEGQPWRVVLVPSLPMGEAPEQSAPAGRSRASVVAGGSVRGGRGREGDSSSSRLPTHCSPGPVPHYFLHTLHQLAPSVVLHTPWLCTLLADAYVQGMAGREEREGGEEAEGGSVEGEGVADRETGLIPRAVQGAAKSVRPPGTVLSKGAGGSTRRSVVGLSRSGARGAHGQEGALGGGGTGRAPAVLEDDKSEVQLKGPMHARRVQQAAQAGGARGGSGVPLAHSARPATPLTLAACTALGLGMPDTVHALPLFTTTLTFPFKRRAVGESEERGGTGVSNPAFLRYVERVAEWDRTYSTTNAVPPPLPAPVLPDVRQSTYTSTAVRDVSLAYRRRWQEELLRAVLPTLRACIEGGGAIQPWLASILPRAPSYDWSLSRASRLRMTLPESSVSSADAVTVYLHAVQARNELHRVPMPDVRERDEGQTLPVPIERYHIHAEGLQVCLASDDPPLVEEWAWVAPLALPAPSLGLPHGHPLGELLAPLLPSSPTSHALLPLGSATALYGYLDSPLGLSYRLLCPLLSRNAFTFTHGFALHASMAQVLAAQAIQKKNFKERPVLVRLPVDLSLDSLFSLTLSGQQLRVGSSELAQPGQAARIRRQGEAYECSKEEAGALLPVEQDDGDMPGMSPPIPMPLPQPGPSSPPALGDLAMHGEVLHVLRPLLVGRGQRTALDALVDGAIEQLGGEGVVARLSKAMALLGTGQGMGAEGRGDWRLALLPTLAAAVARVSTALVTQQQSAHAQGRLLEAQVGAMSRALQVACEHAEEAEGRVEELQARVAQLTLHLALASQKNAHQAALVSSTVAPTPSPPVVTHAGSTRVGGKWKLPTGVLAALLAIVAALWHYLQVR